tara:strand:- start:470 stop:685 length:216 start_codon:yes stop_codon:yes gene_type:complete
MDKLKGMHMFLSMVELTNGQSTKEEKLKQEERIIFATMRASIPDWQPPADWQQLPAEERERRINALKKLDL